MLRFVLVACLVAIVSAQSTCPSGGRIYTSGISSRGKQDVLNAHNKYRNDISAGRVPGQPRGTNLKTMRYDNVLGQKGRVVSNSCQMKHKDITDDRWWYVGQNLAISWNSQYDSTNSQDWNWAVKKWFDEHKDFTYPATSRGVTGHYTQVVWADSNYVGCDFISFYDNNKPKTPYAKLYTCNYGPGGNVNIASGAAPYKRA